MTARSAPPWTVLLIGGASGTGKTLAAEFVARRFGIPWLQVDDFRLAIQRATTPEQLPELHYFVNAATDDPLWTREEDELVEALRRVAAAMSSALEIVIAHHLNLSQPVVLEGDGLDPALLAKSEFAGASAEPGRVRGVVLVEPDEAALRVAFEARGPRGDPGEVETFGKQARVAWRYGQWLQQQAKAVGVPLVASRPYERLPARLEKELS
jgi:2-phosphoglycerate kinase